MHSRSGYRQAAQIICCLCCLCCLTASASRAQSAAAKLMPEVFGKGVISTPDDEIGGALSADGREFYFLKQPPSFFAPGFSVICVSRLRGTKWSEPEILPFSGWYLNTPPHMSPDGKRLYFASTKPIPSLPDSGSWIWYAERRAEGWSDPQPLPAPINSAQAPVNADPSVAADGTLYFASARDTTGLFHIYRSRLVNGAYQEPELLGPEINLPGANVFQPFVSPDRTVLLFGARRDARDKRMPVRKLPGELVSPGQPYARTQLYVAEYRSGTWMPARHLGHGINTSAESEYPFLSLDGKTLFFSSERNGVTASRERPVTYDELDGTAESIYNGFANVFSIGAHALELSR